MNIISQLQTDISNNSAPSLVSVIIASYNASKFIRKTINSILNQTYKNIEIIVVDDASDDDTWEILQEYAASNKIQAFRHQTRQGTGMARNTGINHSKGDWIKPFDADDIMYENCIETLVSHAVVITNKTNRHDTIISAYHDYIQNDEILPDMTKNNHVSEADEINNLDHFELCSILLHNDLPVNTIGDMWHRSEFMKCGMYDRYFREDYELRLRLCVLYGWNMHIIPTRIGAYRQHTQSKMSTVTPTTFQHESTKITNSIISNVCDKNLRESYEEILGHMNMYRHKPPLTLKIGMRVSKFFPYFIYAYLAHNYRKKKYGAQYADVMRLREDILHKSESE